MGAFNGRRESNTRFFDDCLNWDGLLVEPNPTMTPKLLEFRPHAHKMFYAPSCNLQQQKQNATIEFHAIPYTSATQEGVENSTGKAMVDVPCGTLTEVLLDLFPNRPIDFYSLDVEGAEPFILENLNLNAVKIHTIMAESQNRMCMADCPSRERVRTILRHQYGYYLYTNVISHSDLFVHPEFYETALPPDNKRLKNQAAIPPPNTTTTIVRLR